MDEVGWNRVYPCITDFKVKPHVNPLSQNWYWTLFNIYVRQLANASAPSYAHVLYRRERECISLGTVTVFFMLIVRWWATALSLDLPKGNTRRRIWCTNSGILQSYRQCDSKGGEVRRTERLSSVSSAGAYQRPSRICVAEVRAERRCQVTQ